MCSNPLTSLAIAIAVCVFGLLQAEAFAQRGGIYHDGVNPYNSRPTVSPYLKPQYTDVNDKAPSCDA